MWTTFTLLSWIMMVRERERGTEKDVGREERTEREGWREREIEGGGGGRERDRGERTKRDKERERRKGKGGVYMV